jgi:hypothetical protein
MARRRDGAMKFRLTMLAMALALAACATSGHEEILGPPSLEVSEDVPAPERAELYADCVAQSAAERMYFREARDPTLLRFNCEGDVAQRFFEGLGPYSARVGSEMVVRPQTWRFTHPIQRDLVGLDYCIRDDMDAAAPRYTCTVVLNVGEFLRD